MRSRVFLFGLLFAWCGLLVALRIGRAHTIAFTFLPWNLFLAAIPAVAGAMFARAQHDASRIILFVVWLLFLPNAPYLITDFMHLTPRPPVPLWFDIALLASCAGTGLLLAYTSVADVQIAIAQRFGRAAGWIVAIGSLLLTGYGIYLGRFLRWNSWDPIAHPQQLLGIHPVAHARTVAVTFVYGVAVTLGYVALRTIAATLPREKWPHTHPSQSK